MLDIEVFNQGNQITVGQTNYNMPNPRGLLELHNFPSTPFNEEITIRERAFVAGVTGVNTYRCIEEIENNPDLLEQSLFQQPLNPSQSNMARIPDENLRAYNIALLVSFKPYLEVFIKNARTVIDIESETSTLDDVGLNQEAYLTLRTAFDGLNIETYTENDELGIVSRLASSNLLRLFTQSSVGIDAMQIQNSVPLTQSTWSAFFASAVLSNLPSIAMGDGKDRTPLAPEQMSKLTEITISRFNTNLIDNISQITPVFWQGYVADLAQHNISLLESDAIEDLFVELGAVAAGGSGFAARLLADIFQNIPADNPSASLGTARLVLGYRSMK